MTTDLHLWQQEDTPWLIVDQLMCGSYTKDHSNCPRYTTHHLCGNCLSDLSSLSTLDVRCCPYCEIPLPNLMDLGGQPHLDCHGPWPYQLVNPLWRSERCNWMSTEGQPVEVTPTGGTSTVLARCRLIADHEGECRFTGSYERRPVFARSKVGAP